MSLGAVAGTLVCGPLLVKLGQRATLCLGLPICVAAWLIVAFTPTVWLLQGTRFILGMTASLLNPSACSYILEVAHARFRGKMAGSMTLAANIGTLFVFFIGSWRLSWRQVALACAVLSALPLPGIFFLPESPRWLVTRGREVKAYRALRSIRGNQEDLDLELSAITGQVALDARKSGGVRQQLEVLFHVDTLRVLWLLVSLTLFLACCGIIPITAYLVPILQEASTSIDPYTIGVVFAAAKVVGILLHLAVVDRLGRRPLVIIPFFICSACTATYGVYSYLLYTHRVSAFDWLPYTALVLFNFCNGVGTPCILTLQGELLPNSCRAVGLALLTCLLMLGGFASSYTYPMTAEALGQHGAFWLFSLFSAALVLVAVLALPETRGRTLEDITSSAQQLHQHRDAASGSAGQRSGGSPSTHRLQEESVVTSKAPTPLLQEQQLQNIQPPTISPLADTKSTHYESRKIH